jgi:hypothetical protein
MEICFAQFIYFSNISNTRSSSSGVLKIAPLGLGVFPI